MADKEKTEGATEKKARKPRKTRTVHLLCGVDGKWTSVASGKSLSEVRSYVPTDEQDSCHFVEVVQIGVPFVLRREQTTVRTPVK